MSNFSKEARHPETGEIEVAHFIDNYYGPHEYGVRFEDGKVFPIEELDNDKDDARRDRH